MIEFSLTQALAQRILPAIQFEQEEEVLPVLGAMAGAGLRTIEITFRSSVTAKAIQLARVNFPGMYVGAGTVLNELQLRQAIESGAQFGLAPGFNPSVCLAAQRLDFPFIPGVMTPSEIDQAAGMGFRILKLFPAEQLGGPAYLRAMMGPFARLNLEFIPMGGVNPGNMGAYLSLKNVIAVGGSWLASPDLIAARNYQQIENNTRVALQLAADMKKI